MNVKPLYICIDARMIHHGGIGTYLQNLLKHFDKMLIPYNIIDFEARIYSIKEQIEFYKKKLKCDLFWSPHFNVPILPIQASLRIFTLHDVYHLDHFTNLSLDKKLYLKTIFPLAIKKTDRIITVSKFSKERILSYFPQYEKKITVIHPGADHFDTLDATPVSNIPNRFFLFVGNKKPHKNRNILYEALRANHSMHLVVVGEKEIIGADLENRIQFFPKLSNQELKWMYQNAFALIFPSFYEGWGLPPLEAMRMGCPVIASNKGSIPEACGQACIYFNPCDYQDLLEKIQSLSIMRAQLIELGKRQAAQFTWEKTAKKHLQTFMNSFEQIQEQSFF